MPNDAAFVNLVFVNFVCLSSGRRPSDAGVKPRTCKTRRERRRAALHSVCNAATSPRSWSSYRWRASPFQYPMAPMFQSSMAPMAPKSHWGPQDNKSCSQVSKCLSTWCLSTECKEFATPPQVPEAGAATGVPRS